LGLFVLTATEELLQEVLFLGWCDRLRRVGGVAVGRSIGRLANDGRAGCGWRGGGRPGCIRRDRLFVAADAEDLLDEVLRILAHLTAGVDGRRAVEEGNVEAVVGTGGVDQETGRLIDVGDRDTLG